MQKSLEDRAQSARAVRTTCPYCGVGCGVIAARRADGSVTITGDPEHPANFGRLCSKGAALADTLGLEGRILHPLIDGTRASWDEALDVVAARFSGAIAEHGPESVALYISGQLLTEDYYVANKLMKGFIGSSNIDTNSRLCMASSVAGHKRAFGADTVPGVYEDLECADLVVLVGSNLAWCHPVLFQRLSAAKEARGTRIVVVDPRRTATCDIADLHLPIAPGSDVALFSGLLVHLAERGYLDQTFVETHTSGLDAALSAAHALSRDRLVRLTTLSPELIAQFYDWFSTTERVVTVYSQGVNQSSAGTDKVNAIINCHLATGRIGRPGMGPFSITGQPNAMGGREVGGLATMLAAHLDLENADHRRIVQTLWQSPRIAEKPGLKAVDLFQAAADGRIKALWIMATNPVDSVPDADRVREAIRRCPFVVVSDIYNHTDTATLAHVLLPSTGWGEKDGIVTNSERRLSRQRSFLPPPGEARPDWWQLAQVARRMGFARAFAWSSPAEIFTEYAALTGVANDGARDLDLGALAGLTAADYDALAPVQWPVPAGKVTAGPKRFFADGRFFTPDARARFIATPYRPPAAQPGERFPFLLNTGRIRDQWHTMTRTGRAARLMSHRSEPFIDMHPADADRRGLRDGAIAEIESERGRCVARVRVDSGQRQGEVFLPFHWTDDVARHARVDVLVAPVTDPVSGQPELKATAVDVRPLRLSWHAFGVMLGKPVLPSCAYAVCAPIPSGWQIMLAGADDLPDAESVVKRLMDDLGEGCEQLAYHDRGRGESRRALFKENRLIGAFFLARTEPAVAHQWLIELLGSEIPVPERLSVLAGRPGGPQREKGPIVCACFAVGRSEIIEAIVRHGCRTTADLGARLQAGSNCGSCRPELGKLLHEARLAHAG